jgi:subtilisin family serine protease
MKKTIFTLIALAISSMCFAQANDSVYFYVNGIPYWLYIQHDVYTFRMQNGAEYAGSINPTIVVDFKYDDPRTSRQVNQFFFSSTSTEKEREDVKEEVRATAGFEAEFLTLTHSPNLDFTYNEWKSTNDLVLVLFQDPEITPTEVDNFADTYNLTLMHAPENPQPPNRYTYIFKVNSQKDLTQTTAEAAAEIYEEASSIVYWIEPDFVMLPTLFSNDPYFGAQWHIKNTSQCIGQQPTGTPSAFASAHFDFVWSMTGGQYTGNGIKVAVFDFDGYEVNHPDLAANLDSGWNFGPTIPTRDISPNYSGPLNGSGESHGEACAGIIAAIADNSIGTIGVAHGCRILPYKMGTSGSDYIRAFQKARIEADVISISWGWTYTISFIQNEIYNCKTQGRNGKGNVIVAAAGNFDAGAVLNCLNKDSVFPANSPDVIGVVATNPNDELKTSGTYPATTCRIDNCDGWGCSGSNNGLNWASNYGPLYDIAAPGTHLITTDYQGSSHGYNDTSLVHIHNYCNSTDLNSDYTYFAGTSAAAPMVAGLAASILSADTNLTSDSVQYYIQAGADKVGGYNYNAVAPGKSLELGYGRINAWNAIHLLIGIKENELENAMIHLVNPAREQLEIFYNLREAKQNVQLKLVDVLGRTVYENTLSPQQTHFIADISKLATGAYLAIFADAKGKIFKTAKLLDIK